MWTTIGVFPGVCQVDRGRDRGACTAGHRLGCWTGNIDRRYTASITGRRSPVARTRATTRYDETFWPTGN